MRLNINYEPNASRNEKRRMDFAASCIQKMPSVKSRNILFAQQFTILLGFKNPPCLRVSVTAARAAWWSVGQLTPRCLISDGKSSAAASHPDLIKAVVEK